MAARTGAVLLALLMAFLPAMPAEGGDGHHYGPLGGIHPDIEVEGWAVDGMGRSVGPRLAGPASRVRDALGGAGFAWADTPYALADDGTVGLVGADDWHVKGRLGDGIRVAVVDLGFDGYRGLLGRTLPGSVTTESFRRDGTISGGTAHGTAAAEVVHAVAPGADLLLVAFDGDLFRVVQYLIDQRVDVVSFSMGYLSGPFDGTSPASRAVQWAIDAGIVWVTAAGNYADDHWGGSYSDADGDRRMEFSGSDEFNELTVAAGAEFHVYLSWTGDADLDLCLYDMAGITEIACAAGTQDAGDRGLEVVKWKNETSATKKFGYAIVGSSGKPQVIDVHVWNVRWVEHTVARGSIVAPGDVPDAVTVGAVWPSDPDRVAAYSGRGPTAAGVGKPDVVAPTGAATTSWGVFGGTSGAAPHAAGIASLLLGSYPATPADQMADLMARRAIDIGQHSAAGAGRVAVGPRSAACGGLAPTIVGSRHSDHLSGTAGDDVIHAGGGDDVVYGRGGRDVVCGGRGDDLLYGGGGPDRLLGGSGDDEILGEGGRDRLVGGPGEDLLDGGSGKDRCRTGKSIGCE